MILDNDTAPPTTNPVDEARFFVNQHYSDFLNRVPDTAGLDYWTNQIAQCGSDVIVLTRDVERFRRVFVEQEFQQTVL